MTEKPTLAHLLDACHLLEVGLIWDPKAFPDGPTEEHRPAIMASLGVAAEALRALEANPRVMPGMRQIHGDALGAEALEITKHSMTVLSYHAEILRGVLAADVVEDAVALVTAAVSLLASHMGQHPYQRIRLATFNTDGQTPCPGCGGLHA